MGFLRLNVSRISKLFLLIAIMLLIGNTVAISRDYQDSWILEGLELPFALFVIAYAVAFLLEKRALILVVLATVGRAVFLLIPNLKYDWFEGTYSDQFVQYGLANYVCSTGHILTTSTVTIYTPYISSPFLHLSFSIFSIVSNVSVVDSMKYVPVLWSLVYPLLTYIIVETMEFAQRSSLLKYALFFSSVPINTVQYLVTGSLFGSLLAFLVLATLMVVLQKNNRLIWVVCALFVFTLAAGHSVTSIILSACLLFIVAIQRFSRFLPKLHLQAATALVFASISVAWLVFNANYTLEQIVQLIFVGAPTGVTPASERISSTFYEHIWVNLPSAIRSFMVFYGADALFLILSLGGLIILLRMRKKLNRAASFLLLFGVLILLLIVIGYFLKLGSTRSLFFMEFLYPVFAGLFVLQISMRVRSRKVRTGIVACIFFSVMLLATVELYDCQPLISSANVLFKGVPADVPISYVNVVNSIYQRQVIEFAANHINGIIAAWNPTDVQIMGLTPINYSITHVVEYYPIDKTQPTIAYDYFIIQLPGKSGGPPTAQPSLQSREIISEYIQNSTIIYTNGESYILGQHLP